MTNKILLFSLSLFLSVNACAQPDKFPFGMGIPDEPDLNYEKLPVKARLTNANYRDIGASASLADYAPTPKSQGQYGTCTAWAVGFCARTILEAQRYGWIDKSTIDANTFSTGFIFRVTTDKYDCNGAYVSDCVQNMRDIGIPKLSDYSEQCPQTEIPSSVYTKAADYKIEGYATLWNSVEEATEKQKIQMVKKSINEGNPVVIAMFVPNSFCYPKGNTWGRLSSDVADGDQGHQHGRHAMCIIGYDDDHEGGSLRLQNSWGDDWGDGGRLWVKYKDAAEFIYQAIEVFKLPSVKKESETIKLAGALQLVEDTGQEMKANLTSTKGYKMNKAYRSGTRFRIYLNNEQPAYVYAFGSDLTNKVYQVFPYAEGVSPMLNYSSNTVPIPSETKHIRMDGTVGTDYLCVLYSHKPLNLEDIKAQIEKQNSRNTFQQKVQNVLSDALMSDDEIKYTSKDGKMSFTSEAKGKSVAAIFLEMEHVD